MAPLPPNSTARLWVDYTTCGEQHSAQIRLAEGQTPAEALTEFSDLITAVEELLYDATVQGARYAESGSNVSNPIADGWPLSWGSGTGQHADTANMLDFVGRSLDGRRVRFCIFGCKFTTSGADFRIGASESAAVEGGVNVLNNAEGTFVSINGFQPVWYQYANIGNNAYWRNKVR